MSVSMIDDEKASGMILGIDLGSSRLKFTLLSQDGTPRVSLSRYYDELHAGLLAEPTRWTAATVLGTLGSCIDAFAKDAQFGTGAIDLICLSATAPDFWILPELTAQPNGPWCEGFSATPVYSDEDLTAAVEAAQTDDPWCIEFCLRALSTSRIVGAAPAGGVYQTRHSWLFSLLTGRHEIDSATACELGAIYRPAMRAWDNNLIAHLLGDVRMPGVMIAAGSVHPLLIRPAAKLGLSATARVALGSCDSLCSMIAAGCWSAGDPFVYYGTYFCAAETWISDYLAGAVASPFEWRLSLPFAGRTLERLICDLYGRDVEAAFRLFEGEVSSATRNVRARLGPAVRKPFVWEEAVFEFSGASPVTPRANIPLALAECFGTSLAAALSNRPASAFATGGGTRSRRIVQAVAEGSGISQAIIHEQPGAIGTALLGLHSINPSLCAELARRRRAMAQEFALH